MNPDQFAHLLSDLIGEGGDGGLTHKQLIDALECAAAAIRESGEE
jgi:hypothetical protein